MNSSLAKACQLASAALSAVGAGETAYLTGVKLLGAPLACSASGCVDILNSDFSSLGGVPLSALGLATYAGVSLASLNTVRNAAEWRWGALGGSTLLVGVSSWLLFVLASQFRGEVCPWCLTSASLSFGSFALVCAGFRREELERSMGSAAGLGALTAVLLAVAFKDTSAIADDYELPFKEPVVATQSPDRAFDVVRKLNAVGAKMYGAFWCSHCYEQKELFGAQALANFPYVECYPEGYKRGVGLAAACQGPDIKGFPTWVIGDELIEGEQSFDELEAAVTRAAQD